LRLEKRKTGPSGTVATQRWLKEDRYREFLVGEYVTVLTDTRPRWPKEERGRSVVVCNTGFEKILVFGERGGVDKKFFLCILEVK
jgi:hypothetical protein